MSIKIKTPEQIEGIRAASILAAKAVQYAATFALPGINTLTIDQKVEEFIRDHGGLAASKGYRGFPASCCTSVNDVICHGIPGLYSLKEGDILNIDVAAILNGYFGDTCRMFEIGECSDYAKRLISVSKECLKLGIAECIPDNHLGNIGYAITRYAEVNGCSVVYEFCGHGVGLAYHEEPEVNHFETRKNTGPLLKPGMTFTIEPMINAGKARAKIDKKDGWTARTIDGKLSSQFEHTILITYGKPEVLTDIYGEFQ